MSCGLGDLPDSFFGHNQGHSYKGPDMNNATDSFLNYSEKKGTGGDAYENLFQMRSENIRMNNKLLNDRKSEERKRTIVTKNASIHTTASPKIDIKKVSSELFKAYKKNNEADKEMHNVFINRQIVPIAKDIVELFLKGLEWSIIKKDVIKKYPETDKIEDALLFIKKLADPVIFISRLATSPELYNNDCSKCREFLHNNHIKIRYVVPMSKCNDCSYRKIESNICSFLGAKMFTIWIDGGDYDRVIAELLVNKKITSAQCQELKAIPDEIDRLSAALKLAAQTKVKHTEWSRISDKDDTNSLTASAADFANRENTVKLVIEKLSTGKTLSEMRLATSGGGKGSDGIVNDAIARLKIINADSLDTCLSERYIVSPGLELVRGIKCKNCSHATPLSCNKQNIVFTDTKLNLLSLNEEFPEAQEILNFFADSTHDINFQYYAQKPTIDIKIDNPGQDLVVDVGNTDTIGKNIEVGKIFCDIPEMEVDVLPPPQPGDDIEVSGLEGNEGFNLTNLL